MAAAHPNDLSSVVGTHIGWENQLLQVVLATCPGNHTCIVTSACPTHVYNIKKKKHLKFLKAEKREFLFYLIFSRRSHCII